jgi:molybdopterin molybdotransferase
MENKSRLLKYSDALEKVQELSLNVSAETVELKQCLHRVLAEDAMSDTDIPSFTKSAMDGFACRKSDLAKPLRILETIPAGSVPTQEIVSGTCSRIMTGAKIPVGADCVVMQEDTQIEEGFMHFTGEKTKDNIIFQGEDIKRGEVVLEKGTFLKEQHLAILATLGYHKVKVLRQLSVAVFVTGSEIVEPGEELKEGQLRNSNAYQLIAKLNTLPVHVNYYGIVKDDQSAIESLYEEISKKHDISISTGGASKGDYDFVPLVLEKLGFQMLFDRLAIQPGKPVSVSHKNNHIALGLSGNPVSSFVQFEILFYPLLEKLLSTKLPKRTIQLPFQGEYARKKSDRLKFIPGKIVDSSMVQEVPFNGSAHLLALHRSDVLIEIPVGVNTIKNGEIVHARLI